MNEIENVVLMITIAEKKKSEEYISYFAENNINFTLGRYGKGTANQEMLDYLGIGYKEKCVLFSFLTMNKSKIILVNMEKKMHLKRMGEGIAFTIPISAIGSKKALDVLIGEVSNEEGEGYEMETENEVIVVITNRGYVDKVMDAARNAGANGGTVIHARGTGIEQAEKFFGTTVGAEKEMIFIVTKTEKRNSIIKAVKENAGITTDAQSILFSLPVSNIAGLTE